MGIQYGRSVANADAVIKHLRTLSPTIAPTGFIQPSIEYVRIRNEDCNISFVYPSYLKVVQNDENKMHLENKNQTLTVFCDNTTVAEVQSEQKIASVSIQLNEASVSAQKGTFTKNSTDEQFAFPLTLPDKSKNVVIVSTSLYELFSSSLEFID